MRNFADELYAHTIHRSTQQHSTMESLRLRPPAHRDVHVPMPPATTRFLSLPFGKYTIRGVRKNPVTNNRLLPPRPPVLRRPSTRRTSLAIDFSHFFFFFPEKNYNYCRQRNFFLRAMSELYRRGFPNLFVSALFCK